MSLLARTLILCGWGSGLPPASRGRGGDTSQPTAGTCKIAENVNGLQGDVRISSILNKESEVLLRVGVTVEPECPLGPSPGVLGADGSHQTLHPEPPQSQETTLAGAAHTPWLVSEELEGPVPRPRAGRLRRWGHGQQRTLSLPSGPS